MRARFIGRGAWLLLLVSAPPGVFADDPLARFGLHETRGVAPGYVEDRACRFCHTDLWESYQHVGMARSFFRPGRERAIEDFEAKPFFHAPSGQHFKMELEDGKYRFSRWQEDEAGAPINVFTQQVDWVLGSGSTSRTYLYRTPGGELYQLPLAWYSQGGHWGMAPGFDRPDHLGVLRQVKRECMFCHNAYPEMPAGSDEGWKSDLFPAELPEGTGCQRCHGPGASHVRLAMTEPVDFGAVKAALVDLASLPTPRRDDVCDQCHLQPSVALAGVRRFGKGDYSFRPGDALPDHHVLVDVTEERPREQRFEINHHPYRLRQSRCYQASGAALGCLDCHDPHRKVPPAEKAAHYRAACATCHESDACASPAMHGAAAANADCVACHMPRRRTEDVVQVVMTDHKISRRAAGPEATAPLAEREPPIMLDVQLLQPERGVAGPEVELYRALIVARAGGQSGVERLQQMIGRLRPRELEPSLELVRGLLKKRRFAEVSALAAALVPAHGENPQLLEWAAIARAGSGGIAEAMALLERVLELDPARPEAWYNLGRLKLGRAGAPEALAHFDRALALRPILAPAWYQRGQALVAQGRPEDAMASFRRALEIDPTDTRSYLALAEQLAARGQTAEARRWLGHGARWAADKAAVARALAAADSGTPVP